MNLFLNPFLAQIWLIDSSVLFHVTPTPDHVPTWNLRSSRVRQSICLKGFKNGAGLVGNYLICWTQMQRLARASRLLTSSLLGQTTHFPRPSTVGNGTTPHGVGTINRLRRLGLFKWTFGMDLSFVSNINPDPAF